MTSSITPDSAPGSPSPGSASGTHDSREGRIGGARGDFVASLGRKLNDARELLAALEQDLSSKSAREELRRRLHALGAGARLLRFAAMTQALEQTLAVIDRGAAAGALREQDLGFVGQTLDDLPTLAWSEVAFPMGAGRTEAMLAAPRGSLPIAAVVVGGEELAAALAQGHRIRAFEYERTDEVDTALELVRGFAPDVVLIDADLTGAAELVELLIDDPLTNAVPVVLAGTFATPEQPARFIALGAARALSKPVAPELVRATCAEVVDADGPTTRITLGQPTLEQLADRLADELRRALLDGVDRLARSHRLPLGEGTEVLGALWGAIARVQGIISERTGGTIRFGGEGPEGAVALAPSLHEDLPGADRLTGRGRGAATDVRLDGRRVVVADDDPGVTWFISDLLRTAGCEVHEALDGVTALELALRIQPELVVSDILMPGLDGFALCRALRRDVALRETPVILLSWKEDLLQRVRELGASAAAYVRKESGSRAILARVREVLRPRARVEARLRGEGEVRGRVDGLTPRVLLELVCQLRKDARVAVRDATYLHEIEVRGGAPRKATRTTSDGSYRSGEPALTSLLGVSAGRFVVTSSAEPVRGELTGTLTDQLERPVAMARAALAVTTGMRTMNVERIAFDEELLADYLQATPEPTRTLIERLGRGTTPKRLLLAGETSPSLIEDILADLAARGAIRAVEGVGQVDLLTPAFDDALAAFRGRWQAQPAPRTPARAIPAQSSSVLPEASEEAVVARVPAGPVSSDAAPSSLEDAVMREISDRVSEPHGPVPAPDPPPIIRPGDLLIRRNSEADIHPDAPLELVAKRPALPSIPPDAVVPAATSSDDFPAAAPVLDAEQTVQSVSEVTPPPGPTAVSAVPSPGRSRQGGGLVLVVLGLATGAAALALWTAGEQPTLGHPEARPSPATSPPVTSAIPPSQPAAAPAGSTGSSNHVASGGIAADDVPGGELPPGFGLLEVRAPAGAEVLVDGKIAGSGPLVSIAAGPGYHEVDIRQGVHDSSQVIEVRAAKTTRVGSTSAP